MQIKTKLILHLIPVTMAMIKKTNNSELQQAYGQKRTFIHHQWEHKLHQ